jgi:orotate phosphoribosyltransferase
VKNKKVLIIDDVLTAGTALKNSIKLIQEAGGTVSAAIIALDRQEQDEGEQVSKKLINDLNIPIFSISSLENLVVYLETAGLKDTAEKLKTSLKN